MEATARVYTHKRSNRDTIMTITARITTRRSAFVTIFVIAVIVTALTLVAIDLPNLPASALKKVFDVDHQIRRMLQDVSIQHERIASLLSQVQTTGAAQPRPLAYLPVVITARSSPDAFEPDDTCVAPSNILPGSVQSRTFASLSSTATVPVEDIDIIQVRFAQAGSYDARVAATDPQLSPRVELSTVCGAGPLDAFTPDGPVRLVVPSANYTLYFRATSLNPNILRLQNTAYRLSLSGKVGISQQAGSADDGVPRVVILPTSTTQP
jgi:hypothetical protein